jgi:hypothetical protein
MVLFRNFRLVLDLVIARQLLLQGSPMILLEDVTPFAVRMRLVVALVIPFFIYCDCVYFALDSYSLIRLTVAFNAYVRYTVILLVGQIIFLETVSKYSNVLQFG